MFRLMVILTPTLQINAAAAPTPISTPTLAPTVTTTTTPPPTPLSIPSQGRVYIICGVLIALILVILIEIFFRRRLATLFRTILRSLYKYPLIATIAITTVVISLVLFVEPNVANYFSESNVLSILGVVGIFGTIIGVILTYEQLKIAEDRIDGYAKFYQELFE